MGEFAPGSFKRVPPRCVRSPLEMPGGRRLPREHAGLHGESRCRSVDTLCRYLCFECWQLDRAGCTWTSFGVPPESERTLSFPSFPPSLSLSLFLLFPSLLARRARVNLRTRGRAEALPRVLSSFIASLRPSWLSIAAVSWRLSSRRSSKSFARDRGVCNSAKPNRWHILIGRVVWSPVRLQNERADERILDA